MTKTAIALVLYTAGTAAYAGQPQPKVTVFVQNTSNVPGDVFIPAEGLAGKMFARIGISLQWRAGKSAGESSPRPIFIEFAMDTPDTLLPGALAFARPYEGSQITVFFDRVKSSPHPGTVLAHVMVHEITHLLQGIARHSATGIMKARWTTGDYRAMDYSPLPFTPEDVDLIHAGLAKRGGTEALSGSALAGRP
jgi:hypothetical protein